MKFNVLSDLNVQICSPRTAAGALCALVIATATLLHSPYAVAEFYARQDHLGRKHLSNLPPSVRVATDQTGLCQANIARSSLGSMSGIPNASRAARKPGLSLSLTVLSAASP